MRMPALLIGVLGLSREFPAPVFGGNSRRGRTTWDVYALGGRLPGSVLRLGSVV